MHRRGLVWAMRWGGACRAFEKSGVGWSGEEWSGEGGRSMGIGMRGAHTRMLAATTRTKDDTMTRRPGGGQHCGVGCVGGGVLIASSMLVSPRRQRLHLGRALSEGRGPDARLPLLGVASGQGGVRSTRCTCTHTRTRRECGDLHTPNLGP